jgi:hypothetical protein
VIFGVHVFSIVDRNFENLKFCKLHTFILLCAYGRISESEAYEKKPISSFSFYREEK